MKTIKPDKKVQKQIQKEVEDLFGKLNPGYQGFTENYKNKYYEAIIGNLTIAYIIAMVWALSMTIYTTYIILKY